MSEIEGASGAFGLFLQEGFMPDNKRKTGSPDSKRINVNEDYELRDWSKSLGVTPDELKEAVKKVGTSAEKVREHLSARK